MPRRVFILFSFAAALAMVVLHCAPPGESGESPAQEELRPVLLVCADGMEWRVILPMLRDGRLPNIAKMMQRGSYGKLGTTEPTISPIIWTSMATGVLESQHGVLGFSREIPGTDGDQALYTSTDRTAKAYWNILSDFERRVAVIGWWLTYPAETVNGVMVAQTNTSSITDILAGKKLWRGALEQGVPRQVYPPERQDEFLSFVPEATVELPELTRRVFGEIEQGMEPVPRLLWENTLWAFRADETYRRVAMKLLDERPVPDLLSVYFGGTDIVGHRFWRYYEPERYAHRPTEAEIARYGDVIPTYYATIDRFVGELIAAASDDANVLIVSDHGMRSNHRKRRYEKVDQVHKLRSGGHKTAVPGVFIASGPDIARTEESTPPAELSWEQISEVGSVYDLTPTLLHLLLVPVGRDMEGKVMTGVIAPAFLETHAVRWVESHTTEEWLESRALEAVEPLDEEERMEQLRALGYIE